MLLTIIFIIIAIYVLGRFIRFVQKFIFLFNSTGSDREPLSKEELKKIRDGR